MKVAQLIKSGLKTAGFMLALSWVLITCVSALHLATADRVAQNDNLFLQRAVLQVADVAVPDEPAAVNELFHKIVTANRESAPDRFDVHDPADGSLRARVFKREARGLWGAIHAVVGLDPKTQKFMQIRFLEHNETPGLGARIEEPWFQQQMQGKTGPFVLKPEGTHSDQPTEIDAITGATITTVAVRDMLNDVARTSANKTEVVQ